MPDRQQHRVTVPPDEWTFIGDNRILDTKIYLRHANDHDVDYLVDDVDPARVTYADDEPTDGYRLLSVPNEIAAQVDVNAADGLPPGMR